MGRFDSVAMLWSILVSSNRDSLRDLVDFTPLRFAVLIRMRHIRRLLKHIILASKLLLNGVLDSDLLLASILLRRRQLRSEFVVIGRP